MLPSSYPINRALFASFSSNDLEDILCIGCIQAGKRVATFQCWFPNISNIHILAVLGFRWVRIWGLLVVDGRTMRRVVISVARIMVGAATLGDIPRMIRLEDGDG